ncbi:DUF2975 domain-containing protein [Chitinophaga sp. 22321]|uniref:DUF2975 domain-containing protein n=1 Tax=Chitinophaga hostae TaxID=2831022 RepID=A0ABS5J0M5_9BACT|nr:DUF2975 domain-containing protein [Chitinophaga hostae]MBS0028745.1 DUF2975 domain-containing protein [Chitinophaga hostae]
MNISSIGIMVMAPYIIIGVLCLLIAIDLYKLVLSTRGDEVISRENLARVKRIQYIFLAVLLIKAGMLLIMTTIFVRSVMAILMQLVGIVASSWELFAGMLIIYILAKVFERAVNLKEEQALTI